MRNKLRLNKIAFLIANALNITFLFSVDGDYFFVFIAILNSLNQRLIFRLHLHTLIQINWKMNVLMVAILLSFNYRYYSKIYILIICSNSHSWSSLTSNESIWVKWAKNDLDFIQKVRNRWYKILRFASMR